MGAGASKRAVGQWPRCNVCRPKRRRCSHVAIVHWGLEFGSRLKYYEPCSIAATAYWHLSLLRPASLLLFLPRVGSSLRSVSQPPRAQIRGAVGFRVGKRKQPSAGLGIGIPNDLRSALRRNDAPSRVLPMATAGSGSRWRRQGAFGRSDSDDDATRHHRTYDWPLRGRIGAQSAARELP